MKERGQEERIDEVYGKAVEQMELPTPAIRNVVKEIYEPFTTREISDKIGELLTPPDMKAEVQVLYQSIQGLHAACPEHHGDWYFTGDFPTPGGNKVVNRSFINYVEGKKERAY